MHIHNGEPENDARVITWLEPIQASIPWLSLMLVIIICFSEYPTVTCTPPCEHGVCVAVDTCVCSTGYAGVNCNEIGKSLGE